ncbi:MAG: hypothetical protein J7L04_00465, partial [Bacteroidales bacterium]|nr:hypothetical protein [Bacteroidales bacterium]
NNSGYSPKDFQLIRIVPLFLPFYFSIPQIKSPVLLKGAAHRNIPFIILGLSIVIHSLFHSGAA